MAYKPIQVGQINTNQVAGYTAKPAEIVFDDQINKLHLGGADGKLKGIAMDSEKGVANGIAMLNAEGKIDDAFINTSDYELITEYTTTGSNLNIIEISNLQDFGYDLIYAKFENIRISTTFSQTEISLSYNNDSTESTSYTNLYKGGGVYASKVNPFPVENSKYYDSSIFANLSILLNINKREAYLIFNKYTDPTKVELLLEATTYSSLPFTRIRVACDRNTATFFKSGMAVKIYGKKGGVA